MKKIGILAAGLLICGSVVFAKQYNSSTFETMGLNFLAPSVSDKSDVLNPVEGEIIYERTSTDANFWGRTDSGWVNMGGASAVIPPGVIMPFGGTTAPAGYALCDGSAVSRTTYAALFAVIGTAFGAGDGSTTFNLPDLRGRFLRGVDGAAGRDPGAAGRSAMNSGGNTGNTVGSIEGQATAKNGLALSDPGHAHTFNNGTGGAGSTAGTVATGQNAAYSTVTTTSVTTGVTLGAGDAETRPVNANINYIIKL